MIHIFNSTNKCENCWIKKEKSANDFDFDCVATQIHDVQITCIPQLFRYNFLTIQEIVRELEKLLENHPKFNGISISTKY